MCYLYAEHVTRSKGWPILYVIETVLLRFVLFFCRKRFNDGFIKSGQIVGRTTCNKFVVNHHFAVFP